MSPFSELMKCKQSRSLPLLLLTIHTVHINKKSFIGLPKKLSTTHKLKIFFFIFHLTNRCLKSSWSSSSHSRARRPSSHSRRSPPPRPPNSCGSPPPPRRPTPRPPNSNDSPLPPRQLPPRRTPPPRHFPLPCEIGGGRLTLPRINRPLKRRKLFTDEI